MLLFGKFPLRPFFRLHVLSLVILPILGVGGVDAIASSVLAQVPDEEVIIESQDSDALDTDPLDIDPLEIETPEGLRPLQQANNVLSLQRASQLVQEADEAIANQDFSRAKDSLQESRQIFNQLSNFYQQLSQTFSGIDNRISDSQRRSALETAQMRDRTTYKLALVHKAENKPELSVPLFIQILRSQNPTSDLGTRAYNQLLELGFVDVPYPLPEGTTFENIPMVEDLASRPLYGGNTVLSLAGGQGLMDEASSAIDNQDYDLAQSKLQEARQVLNQLSNFYQQLSDGFSGIESLISERQRKNALQAAQMRDRSTYQLALVHRAKNQPELAVPLLLQIVRSQNPTTDLGKRAYQQLFELGFVETPYPRPRSSN